MKRDKIFYAACGLSGAGILFAALGYDFSFVLFTAAYLLRPVMTEFGLGAKFADERERTIHAKSGDVAFIVLIVALAGFALLQISQGKRPEDLYEIIAIGLAARALTGLIMMGEYRKAGMMIIGAVGFFVGLFIIMEGGLSLVSLFGLAVACCIFGVAWLAKRFPRTVALLLVALVALVIAGFGLYHFRLVNSASWLFIVMPLTLAAACLFLGGGKDPEGVPPRTRSIVFGSLTFCALCVFAALMFFGSREEHHQITFQEMKEGEQREIQGYPCTGTVNYFENGKISTCILAREDTVLGRVLPALTQLCFRADGVLDFVSLPQDGYVDSLFCRGEGPGTWHTAFYPNGQLRLIWPASDQVIQGVPCREATFWTDAFGGGVGVYFHENGKLKRCKLSEDFTIQGKTFKRGSHLTLDDKGNLVESK